MGIKKYRLYYKSDLGGDYDAFEEENDDGEYYRVEDVEALEKERDNLKLVFKKAIKHYGSMDNVLMQNPWHIVEYLKGILNEQK